MSGTRKGADLVVWQRDMGSNYWIDNLAIYVCIQRRGNSYEFLNINTCCLPDLKFIKPKDIKMGKINSQIKI